MDFFFYYMIIGGLLSVYRLYFEDVHPNDPWFKQREEQAEKLDSHPLPIKILVILFLSALMIPITVIDYFLFFKGRLQMRQYNTDEVGKDIYNYVQMGMLYGEAVSYSSYNRFGPEEAEEIELRFKQYEARIVRHGFIPLKLGDFVAFHQDGTDLPKLRIKGKVYPEAAA